MKTLKGKVNIVQDIMKHEKEVHVFQFHGEHHKSQHTNIDMTREHLTTN